jgi:hypothetical protein
MRGLERYRRVGCEELKSLRRFERLCEVSKILRGVERVEKEKEKETSRGRCCDMLRHIAIYCDVLQGVATCCAVVRSSKE